MKRAEYRRWAERQTGRYELVGGEPVAMSPQRARHVAIKTRVWRALDRAIGEAGVGCQAFGDGMTVEAADDTDFEPDALVNCGAPIDLDSVAAPNPIVVVEVLSPSTQSVDTGLKFAGYFGVASIAQFLIVESRRKRAILHSRTGSGIVSRIVTSGTTMLDPPGITVLLEEFYPPELLA